METTITIRSDSVTIDRDIEQCDALEWASTYKDVLDDKTFLIANLLVPKITELMQLSVDELRCMDWETIIGGVVSNKKVE